MRIPLLLLALTTLAAPARAQDGLLPDAVRAAADRITAADLARDVEFFAADALLGRNTPSPGFDAAAAAIAERLEAAGLTPAGDDGTYFQHYDLIEERIDPEGASIEIDGIRFAFGDGFVLRSFAGGLTGTFPVVYAGHGWVVPGEGIDPYGDLDVRGKIVLVHGPDAMPPGVEIRRIGRVAVGATSAFDEARRRGAAGILFVPSSRSLEGWERMRRTDGRMELDPPVPSAYAAIPVTSIVLSAAAAEALLKGEVPAGPSAVQRGDAAEYAPSFELSRAVTLEIPASRTVHRPYNVVALLEGADPVRKDEYVTIESHLDGAVGTAVVDGDSIYNSADDNASGSAANLAIAERMMEAPRPARSLVFIWDSGEERGLWGTRWFVHSPPVPLENVVAHVNIDMIGANRAPGSADSASAGVTGPNEVYLTGPGVLSAGADSLVQRVNREYLGLAFNREFDRPDHEFFYPRTDAGPFLERGVLTIGFFTGIHDRYHRPADEARHLDPDKMEVVARTVFVSAWALANAPERPAIDKEIPALVPRH